MSQTWKLVGPDGMHYTSTVQGTLGGHRRNRIYGRLDCPAALRAIARGGYVTHRVFFLTEEHARAAGYRPCAVCLPVAYAGWKAQQAGSSGKMETILASRRSATGGMITRTPPTITRKEAHAQS
jgi:Metal binding domain of Ada